jgi:hypothetical protein
MVEIVGLLFVFILSVSLAMGAALAVLGVLLAMMRRTAVRPSSRSLVDAPVQCGHRILLHPRRRGTARRRALWFIADPAARRVGSPQPSLYEERRRGLTIDRVRERV